MDQSHSIRISQDPVVSGPVKARRRNWRRLACGVASLVVCLGGIGCAAKQAPAKPSAASLMNPTERDMNARALADADRQLSQATYTVLEKKGPKARMVGGGGSAPSMAENGSPNITNGATTR